MSVLNLVYIADLLEGFLVCSLLGVLKTVHIFLVVGLHDLDLVTLVLIRGLIALNLLLSVPHTAIQLLLLVIELVFERQEVLIEGDTVSQERLIAIGLVLLVDLLVLQQLDLCFHSGDLLVEVQDDVVMDGIRFSASLPLVSRLFDFFCRLLKVRVTFEFLVDDRASCPCIDIEVSASKFDIACGCSTACSRSSYSAYNVVEKITGYKRALHL